MKNGHLGCELLWAERETYCYDDKKACFTYKESMLAEGQPCEKCIILSPIRVTPANLFVKLFLFIERNGLNSFFMQYLPLPLIVIAFSFVCFAEYFH
jgi:hypothetical protein